MSYSPAELMIVSAARALEGSRVVFVGVGLPNIACNLARHSHSPQMELVYESGVFGARPARLPLSIGDPTLVSGATLVGNMADLFTLYLQGGLVDVALLGGAQIDKFGNLNTTVIGDYTNPNVRLPGSGGACEIAINARKTFIITRLQRRTFVQSLDFLTSPGHLSGGNARQERAYPGDGPALVITDRALFNFENEQREMTLAALAPGETAEGIQKEVGWELRISASLHEIDPPSEDELDIIRSTLDPRGRYR